MPRRDFVPVQDDMKLHILRTITGTFSLDAAQSANIRIVPLVFCFLNAD